jgi:hypothetical protein
MIGTYWPLVFVIAGILGVVGQSMLAWVAILVAGLLSLLS